MTKVKVKTLTKDACHLKSKRTFFYEGYFHEESESEKTFTKDACQLKSESIFLMRGTSMKKVKLKLIFFTGHCYEESESEKL